LNIFHKFRDARLAKTVAGRKLTVLYYKHAPEVSEILDRQVKLRIEAGRLLFSLAPEMFLGMFRNQEFRITQAQQNRIIEFMKHLKLTASSELKADIDAVLVLISDGSLQKELGYKIRRR
jgi:hypothetical protein